MWVTLRGACASTRAARRSGRSDSGSRDGRVVAWSWLKEEGRGQLEHDVHPEHLHLLDEILADPAARAAFAFEDDSESRAALTRHGFTQPGTWLHYLVCDLLEPPGLPPLPDGFRCRTVRAEDMPERLDPSRGLVAPRQALARHRVELRARSRGVAVPRIARLRRRGAGWSLRRVLPLLARRREPGWRVRAGRRSGRVPPPWPRRRRLPLCAAALARGRRAPSDRLLRDQARLRTLRVSGLPNPCVTRRVRPLKPQHRLGQCAGMTPEESRSRDSTSRRSKVGYVMLSAPARRGLWLRALVVNLALVSGSWGARHRDGRRCERCPQAVMVVLARLRGPSRDRPRLADRRLGRSVRGRRSRRVFGL